MSADPTFWITQLLNALHLSMLLFLLSIGLTVIFGLLNFVNLAHGALYAVGAYVGVSVSLRTGSYWAALAIAPLVVTLVGVALYVTLIRRLRRAGPMNQVLVTFGLIFVFFDLTRYIWGDIPLSMDVPELLAGLVSLGGIDYPAYRLFVILVGLTVMAGLYVALSRTMIGATIRAGVENDAMAACLGIDVERLFFLVFCVGCALAGLAGVVAVPVFQATTGMGTEILIPTLIVVVIGGPGSLGGAVAGSLIVGFVEVFGAAATPGLSSILVYLLLALVLIFRPAGMFPARG